MWSLMISAIATSAADSLNPIAIAQQFVLQGMVKKPRHIWFFILPTGIVNLLGGFLVYFGLSKVLENRVSGFLSQHSTYFYIAELIIGILVLGLFITSFTSSKMRKLQREIAELKGKKNENEEDEARKKIRSVSPSALVLLGTVATITELVSALPYFAFLAILLNSDVAVWQASIVLIIYNIIYMLPLMVLYFVYVKARNKFDKLYFLMKKVMTKAAFVLKPTLLLLAGAALSGHALFSLLIL